MAVFVSTFPVYFDENVWSTYMTFVALMAEMTVQRPEKQGKPTVFHQFCSLAPEPVIFRFFRVIHRVRSMFLPI